MSGLTSLSRAAQHARIQRERESESTSGAGQQRFVLPLQRSVGWRSSGRGGERQRNAEITHKGGAVEEISSSSGERERDRNRKVSGVTKDGWSETEERAELRGRGLKRSRGGRMGTEGERVSVRAKAASCSSAEDETLEEEDLRGGG